MSQKTLDVKKVVIFKHGVSYYVLKGELQGNGNFELEFKVDEMNDILKSLVVLDTSEKGYISSISYDAAISSSDLLKTIMLDVPDSNSFSSLIAQIKGADITIEVVGESSVSGKVMGIEYNEQLNEKGKINEKLLTLLTEDKKINKIPFTEIKSFEILNEEINKDLNFFLETVIAGKKKDSKKIVINCEAGGEEAKRNIVVSYIRESPVWKTSYRLLMNKEQEKEQKCFISGWCMVENTTNTDWKDIELSLVAGLPVSFKYKFYRPIYIDRPEMSPPKVLSARPTEIEEGMRDEEFKAYEAEAAPGGGRARPKMKRKMEAPRAPPAPSAEPKFASMRMDDSAVMDKLTSQTKSKTKDLGELFEYNISNPVSIRKKRSALVPILSEEIEAKKILLYNQKKHDKNPDACLEITNNSGLVLESGPVTIIYDNNLAGEALIPFLNKNDTRLLNYAVEQAVIVTHRNKTKNHNVHRVVLSGSYSYEYYYSDLHTTYKINNKTTENKSLYLDHPKKAGYEIQDAPIDPEETPNYWRFKLDLKPNEAISFKIVERRENSSSYYLYSYSKDDLFKRIQFYVKNNFINDVIEKRLKEIGEKIGEKKDLEAQRSELTQEKQEMENAQARLRENISVLGNTSQENSLREKYINKLTSQEERFENINDQIKDLNKEIQDLEKEIDDLIQDLNYKT